LREPNAAASSTLASDARFRTIDEIKFNCVKILSGQHFTRTREIHNTHLTVPLRAIAVRLAPFALQLSLRYNHECNDIIIFFILFPYLSLVLVAVHKILPRIPLDRYVQAILTESKRLNKPRQRIMQSCIITRKFLSLDVNSQANIRLNHLLRGFGGGGSFSGRFSCFFPPLIFGTKQSGSILTDIVGLWRIMCLCSDESSAFAAVLRRTLPNKRRSLLRLSIFVLLFAVEAECKLSFVFPSRVTPPKLLCAF